MSSNLNDERIPAGEPAVEQAAITSPADPEPVKASEVKKAKPPKKPAKPKKPWTKKRIITWVVVVVLALLLGYSCVASPILAANAARTQVPMALGTTLLAPRDIATSISATGIVESAHKHYVYPAMAGYTVMEVPVEVGTVVQEGDILCLLDDSAIQDQIASSELSLTQNQKAANQQVKSARDSYNALQNTVYDGTNSTLISAQAQVTSAYNAYLSAVDSYNQYGSTKSKYDSAEQALTAAAQAQTAAQGALTQAEADAAADPANTALAQAVIDAQAALANATAAYGTAEAAYKSAATAYAAVEGRGTSLSLSVDTAYNNYQTALRSMDAAIASVETQLQSSKNQLDSTRISAETAKKNKELTLEQMEESLSDTIVRAPASGTITAVYATVGGPGSGLLFVIEDVSDLIVKTTVKAFDIGVVRLGLPVTIKSDATGEDVYEGSLAFIAPATQKTAMGDTNPASEVFDAEVAVKSRETALRIGMNARLNYIVEKQESVLAVPYDAIYTNAAGQSCVLAALDSGTGKYTLAEMPVTLGIESDLLVAISGEGIVEGLRVLNEPEGRLPGEVITLV